MDGKEINQVTVVGSILNLSHSSTNLSFILDDGSGKFDIKMWMDSNEPNDYTSQKLSSLQQGMYVRVIGNLRSFQGQLSFMAHRINPITDFNEVTYHFLEVIYVHIQNTRGSFQPLQGGAYPFSSTSASVNTSADLNSQVLDVIRTVQGPEGASVAFVCQQLGRDINEIRSVLDFLSSEGHIYPTIDEEHFQTTDRGY